MLFISLTSSAQKGSNVLTSPRKIFNMNVDWAFYRGDLANAEKPGFTDDDWAAVTIPHVMRLEQKHNGGGQIYQGIGWYRKYFLVPKREQGKRITINFDGIQMNCDVFLNGVKLTTHHGGYLGFVVDITNKVRFDRDNVLAVRVSNQDDPQTPPGKPLAKLDFNYYGGIYRDVKLVITNKIYISDPLEANKIAGGGIFITYPKVDKKFAKINVKTHIVNQSGRNLNLLTIIKDKDGVQVAMTNDKLGSDHGEIFQDLIVQNPKLWHPDHPYLYQVISRVYENNRLIDEKITPAGIRTISFRSPSGKADGFYINGEKLYLRGANRHQNYQTIGDAASNSMQYRDALQIKKGGFNAVRAAHYPQSSAFLDACDQIGLLVIECEPGWQYFSKDSVFLNRTYQNVREMIRRDRNRPSVFLWENSLNESPTADFWAKEVVRIAHEEMPNDQMFTADDFFAKGKKFYDVSYKVINEDGTDPMMNMPSLTREWGDTWMADAAKENSLRASRMYTEKGLLAQCLLRQNALNGSMLESEGAYWDHAKLDANPRIAGHFLWSYNDYTRGSDAVTAFSGVVDVDRYEKFGYYQLQAMQSARNPAYGPMVYIASFNNQPTMDHEIIVFSNCDRVKFYRNGEFIKEIFRVENAKTAPYIAAKGGSPYFKFKMEKYEAGELRADAYLDDKLVVSHKVNTPEVADHLEIEIADFGMQAIADQSDMVPFYVKVCDRNGNLVSNTKSLQSYRIDLKVEGCGTLIGADLEETGFNQPTEGGVAYGLVRTSDLAGNVMIKASSNGLKGSQIELKTHPCTQKFVLDGQHAQWKAEKNVQELLLSKTPLIKLQPEIELAEGNVRLKNTGNTGVLKNLIDDNASTIWFSSRENLPAIIEIDFKKVIDLQGSKIIWGKDSDWYTYSIDVSSDYRNWIRIFKDKIVSGQEYKPEIYNIKQIKCVRITVSEVRSENSRLAISDIKFYGISSK